MLSCRDITVSKENVQILDKVNLDVSKGEKLLIHGPSGTGKSTFLKVLLYFEYFCGEIRLNGESVTPDWLHRYRGHFSYIGQQIPVFDATVSEFLLMPFSYKQFRGSQNQSIDHREQIRNLLDRLRLHPDILSKKFDSLSGGEKQRIVTAQMSLLDRPICILDEVTSELDKENINALIELIVESEHRTVIAVSHNSEWENYVDRRVHFNGRSENGK